VKVWRIFLTPKAPERCCHKKKFTFITLTSYFLKSGNSFWWTVFSVIMLVATIYFAIMFISSPVSMAIAGWLYLGVSLITFGVFRISISYRIKQLNKATDGLI